MFPSPKLALVIAGNFSEDEDNADLGVLCSSLPDELASCYEIKEWSCQPSTHYSMAFTLAMEEMFESQIANGCAGIVVLCGSGVMEEMAYFVNLLWRLPNPVIFANLMAESGENQHMGAVSLQSAMKAALSSETRDKGVLICSGREFFSANDAMLMDPALQEKAFIAPLNGPVASMIDNDIKFFKEPKRPAFLARRPKKIPYVEVMWASLGGGEQLLSSLASNRELGGLVLAGFSTGNVPPSWVPPVRNILRSRVPVVITSRCPRCVVHETNECEGSFVKLTEMGVIPGPGLSPLNARIRLSIGISAGLTEKGLRLYMLDQPLEGDMREFYR